jgi:hypothetical protein
LSDRAEPKNHDGRYFSYRGSAPGAGAILERLGHSREFRSIFERVFERGLGRPPSSDALFQVLRCLKGDSGQKESFRYHFDAYVVTALVPIEIPTEGRWHGDLLMYPNIRQVCSSVVVNLLEKVLVQNRGAQRFLAASVVQRIFPPRKLRMTPGNVYIFWGYRSLHANEPCDPDKLRATALFHFGDPHVDSRLTRFIETRRAHKEARVEAKARALAARGGAEAGQV